MILHKELIVRIQSISIQTTKYSSKKKSHTACECMAYTANTIDWRKCVDVGGGSDCCSVDSFCFSHSFTFDNKGNNNVSYYYCTIFTYLPQLFRLIVVVIGAPFYRISHFCLVFSIASLPVLRSLSSDPCECEAKVFICVCLVI